MLLQLQVSGKDLQLIIWRWIVLVQTQKHQSIHNPKLYLRKSNLQYILQIKIH
jgi:hypothetical protein